MLGESARVAVENDRLRGDFHNVVDGSESRGHVDEFDVRLSLRCRIAERGHPHRVELVRGAVLVDRRFFGDKAGDAAVRLDNGHDVLEADQPLKAPSSDIGHADGAAALFLKLQVFALVGVRVFDQPPAVGGKYLDDLVADRFLEARYPVVAVDHEVGLVELQVVLVAEFGLRDDAGYAGYAAQELHSFAERNQRVVSVARHRLVGENADRELSEARRLLDDGNVAAVNDIRREAHIDGPVSDLPELRGNPRQILGRVDLLAEKVAHVVREDVHRAGNFVESVLGVAFYVVFRDEPLDGVHPFFPLVRGQLVERLRGVLFDFQMFHAHSYDPAVVRNHRSEVFFGKRRSRRNAHHRLFGVDDALQDDVLENHVAVHQNHVAAFEVFARAVNRVDVVGGFVKRVVDERQFDRNFQRDRVLFEHRVEISGGDDRLFDAEVGKHFQLPGKNRVAAADLRHAFGLFAGERAHAGAHSRIKN